MAKPFVTQLDVNKAATLRTGLEERGFTIARPPYTLFAAKKPGVSCTLYESGKLVVQGKAMSELIEFYLEPEILGSLEYTNPHQDIDLQPRIGCDEAGKGDFFGPLCVAGVYADEEAIHQLLEWGVADSKRLSDPQSIKLAQKISKGCAHQVLVLRPEKYNELHQRFGNLNHLLAWAHATIIEGLVKQTQCRQAIVDQFAKEWVLERAVERKSIEVELTQRVRAEQDVVVAAGSIVARAAFLHSMDRLSKEFDMEIPKGAGPPVLAAGRKFVARYGQEALGQVAKWHFKTRQQVVGNA